jgi:hypothetical protein
MRSSSVIGNPLPVAPWRATGVALLAQCRCGLNGHSRRTSSVAMVLPKVSSPNRQPTLRARRWEPVQVPPRDLGSGFGQWARRTTTRPLLVYPFTDQPSRNWRTLRSRRATPIATGTKRTEIRRTLKRTAPTGRFSSSSRDDQAAGRATATNLFPSGSRR